MSDSLRSYETIQLNSSKGIYQVVLNRPDKLNTLTEQMCHDLLDAFRYIDNDNSAKVMVLSSKGRAFSAGGDMSSLFLKMIDDRREGKEVFDIPAWLNDASLALRNLPVPTIAAIHGAAIGFGVTICLQCDIRIASDDAVMGLPFVKLGLIPEFGSTYALAHIVGLSKAFELVYTGKNIKAQEAKEIGLVNMVVRTDELDTTVQALAENIAEGAPIAVRRTKEALYAALECDMKQQLRLETEAMTETLETADHEEAIRSFLEKRRPLFKGE